MTLFVALLLGLSMVAAGTRVSDPVDPTAHTHGFGLVSGELVSGELVSGELASGDQASNHELPGEPPPRLLGEQTDDSEEDDTDDERLEFAHVSRSALLLGRTTIRRIVFVEHVSLAAQRAREGHGARGPPIG